VLDGLPRGLVGVAIGLGRDRHVGQLGGGEKCLKAVVIGGRDRIELVIVAAGASDRQAEEHGADGAGDLGKLRLSLHLGDDIAADQLARAASAETRGDQSIGITGG
jgi:hypothetical protein